MFITTTVTGREIVAAALGLHRDMCQDVGAKNRRLGFSEKEAKDALATNKYLQGVFDGVGLGDGDVGIELSTPNAALTLRTMLILWAQTAIKKDQSVHQMTLITDVNVRQSHAQSMLDQLADQLSLPVTDIAALVESQGAKEPKEPKEKKGKTLPKIVSD